MYKRPFSLFCRRSQFESLSLLWRASGQALAHVDLYFVRYVSYVLLFVVEENCKLAKFLPKVRSYHPLRLNPKIEFYIRALSRDMHGAYAQTVLKQTFLSKPWKSTSQKQNLTILTWASSVIMSEINKYYSHIETP